MTVLYLLSILPTVASDVNPSNLDQVSCGLKNWHTRKQSSGKQIFWLIILSQTPSILTVNIYLCQKQNQVSHTINKIKFFAHFCTVLLRSVTFTSSQLCLLVDEQNVFNVTWIPEDTCLSSGRCVKKTARIRSLGAECHTKVLIIIKTCIFHIYIHVNCVSDVLETGWVSLRGTGIQNTKLHSLNFLDAWNANECIWSSGCCSEDTVEARRLATEVDNLKRGRLFPLLPAFISNRTNFSSQEIIWAGRRTDE